MPLSPSAISEIKAELAALHDLKARIDDRVRSLEAVLVPWDFGQVVLPFTTAGDGPAAPPTVRHDTADDEEDLRRSPHASNGLRAAILEALRRQGPMRAPQAATFLLGAGFSNDSSTPLSTRVYNDLWRMTKKGLVANKDGVFSVKG